jgi:hypothetical protein
MTPDPINPDPINPDPTSPEQSADRHLAQAVACLYRGHLAAADAHCRRSLAVAPDRARALNLLGTIAALAGLRSPAADCFARASGLAAAQDNLALLATLPEIAPTVTPGFVLIKAWGFGFWSEVCHVLGGLLLAELTGRTPVIQWGRKCRFSDGRADAFGLFFEPVSDLTVDDLMALEPLACFPEGWNRETLRRDRWSKRPGLGALDYLARSETVLVCCVFIGVADLVPWIPSGHPLHGLPVGACVKALFDRYLRPRPEIMAAVQDFEARHLAGAPVVAVHLRGSDKVLELPELAAVNHRIIALVDALPEPARLLLLTDDARLAREVRRRYGGRVIMTYSRRTADGTGIHYHAGENGVALGREIMIDTWLALRADRFIGNGRSNVSGIIDAVRTAGGRDSTLVLENQLYENTCFL